MKVPLRDLPISIVISSRFFFFFQGGDVCVSLGIPSEVNFGNPLKVPLSVPLVGQVISLGWQCPCLIRRHTKKEKDLRILLFSVKRISGKLHKFQRLDIRCLNDFI